MNADLYPIFERIWMSQTVHRWTQIWAIHFLVALQAWEVHCTNSKIFTHPSVKSNSDVTPAPRYKTRLAANGRGWTFLMGVSDFFLPPNLRVHNYLEEIESKLTGLHECHVTHEKCRSYCADRIILPSSLHCSSHVNQLFAVEVYNNFPYCL